jgi:type II secretion system protein J
MIQFHIKNQRTSGFTLIEVLLGIGILATISMFAIQALSIQIEHRNKLEQRNAAYHAIHVAMSKLYDDFRNLYAAPDSGRPGVLKQALVWKPGGKTMYFTTHNYRSFMLNSPQSNLAQVRYSIKDDPKDPNKKQLWRVVDTNLQNSIEYEDTGMPQLLIDDLAKMEVLFWDGQDFSNLGEWDTTASAYSNKLPKMAKIRLEAYTPISEPEKQLKNLAPQGPDSERQKMTLETIVFLLRSADQGQLKDPSGEYKWR